MKWNQWKFVVVAAAVLTVLSCAEKKDDSSCEEEGTNCPDITEPAGDVVEGSDVDDADVEEANDGADDSGEDVSSDAQTVNDVAEDVETPDEDVSASEDAETPPEDTEVPEPVDVDPTACSGVVDCALDTCAADDEACVEACVSSADEEVQAQATPMIACLQESCLKPAICKEDDEVGGDCFLSCLYLECGEAFETCVDPESEGNGGCAQGLECVLECVGEPGQTGCMSACFGQLSDDAKETLAVFGACLFDPNIPPVGLDECIAAGGACFGQVTGGGDTNCLDTFLCIEENCAEAFADDEEHDEEGDEDGGSDGPPPCIFDCLSQATAEASSLVIAIFGCDMQEGSEEEPDGSFPCGDELLQCSDPSGTLDCSGVFQCLEECESNQGGGDGQTCLLTCLHQASVQGSSDFFAMAGCPGTCSADCSVEEDPDKCMQSCFETKCNPLFESCMGGMF